MARVEEMERQAMRTEEAHTARSAEWERVASERVTAVMAEAAAERHLRVEAQQAAWWHEESAARLSSEGMEDGLNDVIEADRLQQALDCTRTELRTAGEVHVAYVNGRANDILKAEQAVWAQARAELQGAYDAATDRYRAECDRSIVTMHEEQSVQTQRVVSLTAELGVAGEAAS